MSAPASSGRAPAAAGASRMAGLPAVIATALLLLSANVARAGLFDDEEARRAILDLRTRIQANDDYSRGKAAEQEKANAALLEQVQQLRRSLLDLNEQLEAQRADNAICAAARNNWRATWPTCSAG